MTADSTRQIHTAESVAAGHPDKVADRISDAILDAIMREDPRGRVAVETMVTTGLVLVSGEITTDCYVDIPRLVRDTVVDIGYNRAKYGFDGETCAVLTAIDEQSDDIARGVDVAAESRENGGESGNHSLGAGDQGLMVGYACDETPSLMPMPIHLAHRLAQGLEECRRSALSYLRPDGKTQVSVEYVDGEPQRIDTVVMSAQHRADVEQATIAGDLSEHVIERVLPAEMRDDETRVLVNPTGRFVAGGPQADTGATGRKLMVDTYGGRARHGGGAFSGKDPTKVDRSGAYALRYAAKNVVAAGLARECEIQAAYAIGVARPVALQVDTFGTGRISDNAIADLLQTQIDLRPSAIIEGLRLRRPIYAQLASYGHFGRQELDLPWERTDLAEELRRAAGLDG